MLKQVQHDARTKAVADAFLHPPIRALFRAMMLVPVPKVSSGPPEALSSRPLERCLSDTLNFFNIVTIRRPGRGAFSSLGKLKLMELPFSFRGVAA